MDGRRRRRHRDRSRVEISVPAGTWAWCGIWSAQTGGTWVEKFPVNSTTLSAAGTILVTPTLGPSPDG
ncbi:hypothetical protein GS901_04925 [Rhodococcus hoagii]|nr:hypothetical protein [Prescottella equi]